MSEEVVVIERSAQHFKSDRRQRSGYSKKCGLAADATRPYKPIGDLSSMLSTEHPLKNSRGINSEGRAKMQGGRGKIGGAESSRTTDGPAAMSSILAASAGKNVFLGSIKVIDDDMPTVPTSTRLSLIHISEPTRPY